MKTTWPRLTWTKLRSSDGSGQTLCDILLQYSVSYSVRAISEAICWLGAASVVDETAVKLCERTTRWKCK